MASRPRSRHVSHFIYCIFDYLLSFSFKWANSDFRPRVGESSPALDAQEQHTTECYHYSKSRTGKECSSSWRMWQTPFVSLNDGAPRGILRKGVLPRAPGKSSRVSRAHLFSPLATYPTMAHISERSAPRNHFPMFYLVN
jgi:hypothetical protein